MKNCDNCSRCQKLYRFYHCNKTGNKIYFPKLCGRFCPYHKEAKNGTNTLPYNCGYQ